MCEPGQLILLSGPSGAGKSTVVRKLLSSCDLPLELSVSATTRAPRKGEVEGRDYHFVTHEQFKDMRTQGKFLECKEVFGRGDWYGTPSDRVEDGIQAGKWMILEIDVQGAMSVMEKRKDALSFFVHPGTREELEKRLVNRGTDDAAAIQRRLEVADEELTALSYYKFEIINRDVERAVEQICQVLQQYNRGSKPCLKS